ADPDRHRAGQRRADAARLGPAGRRGPHPLLAAAGGAGAAAGRSGPRHPAPAARHGRPSMRGAGAARRAALGLALGPGVAPAALEKKKIVCRGGETRLEVSVKELAIQYEGWSLSGTLSSLSVLGTRLAVDPKTLQQAAAATQQWNELLKGLAAGWNSCVL